MAEDNAIILPSEVVNRQICTECYNFLSVGPILMTENKDILCGRENCSKENYRDLKHSIFNEVAEHCFFPCINYLDGCDTILPFNNVAVHEETCCKSIIECFICSFQGNSLQLLKHYEYSHPESVIENDRFEFHFTNELDDIFIYHKFNSVFAIHAIIEDNLLSMDVLNMNGQSEIKNYKVFISSRDAPNTLYSSGLKPMSFFKEGCFWIPQIVYKNESPEEHAYICTMDITRNETIENQVLEKKLRQKQAQIAHDEAAVAELMEQLHTKLEDVKIKEEMFRQDKTLTSWKKFASVVCPLFVKCTVCEMSLNRAEIFICPRNHSCCESCIKSVCNKCNAICQWRSCKDLTESLRFCCDWENCNEIVNIQHYLFHKQECEFRTYDCPLKECRFSGTLKDFVKHWHSKLPYLKVLKELPFEEENFECYWVVDRHNLRELVHVIVTLDQDQMNVTVEEVSVILPAMLKLKLYHIENNGIFPRRIDDLKESGTSRKVSILWNKDYNYKLRSSICRAYK